MNVRQSTPKDLPWIMEAIAYSRMLMRQSGNDVQWTNGYPSEAFIAAAIDRGENYVILLNDEVIAAFCFILEHDPNYTNIENGTWLNDAPYGVIHRLAKRKNVKGVAAFCFNWCVEQFPNVRLDTHASNLAMQHVLKQVGFEHCGTIYVSDGTPRLAFQKIKA